ncbi:MULTISPECIES: proline iminopeptidase-family hydrolase [Hymenobacter]|uniref:Alpha/beta fold hydrolase n=1 Tax=Hymenobacter jejuensis TaxID=2502781 RepID=A0A5B7ZYF0_9BACT|nr:MULTISPECIES: proline iminopeptidase-family hydrolase [Hymenobacter]MBC6988837.1 proline iminopeptidase-family hydrolase [Hymenobacter sp. BT491]QDA58852.1 alpha/beta fold hydrolase [Hymenobacter jejuensis]
MLKKLLGSALLLTLLGGAACTPQTKSEASAVASEPSVYFAGDTSAVKDGGVQVIPISTPKGKFNIWTKRFGNNPRMKVLLLNGGPGATHEYFECMESFLPKDGIEFIYYDQLGCGLSDNPKDTAMWSLPRYVEEVEQVRKALNLNKDNFYLLGHSWGGILAAEYALKYQQNLKGLIISNMMMSVPAYGKYADNVLAKQMKPEVLAEIRQIEAKNDFENPRYMELLMPNFYVEHICRIPLDKWPEPLTRSLGKMNQSLYVTMQGPSEFGVAGKLLHWDRTKDLPKLSVPVLSIGGKYDTMDPEHMRWIATQVQNGTALICPKGSHMSLYDDQQTYMNGLTKFILAVDKGEKKVAL